jgi:hypothetical protein
MLLLLLRAAACCCCVQTLVVMLAAFETTASTFCTALMVLPRHPEVRATLYCSPYHQVHSCTYTAAPPRGTCHPVLFMLKLTRFKIVTSCTAHMVLPRHPEVRATQYCLCLQQGYVLDSAYDADRATQRYDVLCTAAQCTTIACDSQYALHRTHGAATPPKRYALPCTAMLVSSKASTSFLLCLHIPFCTQPFLVGRVDMQSRADNSFRSKHSIGMAWHTRWMLILAMRPR